MDASVFNNMNSSVNIWSGRCNNSLIHSSHFYSASSSPLLLRSASDYSTDTVSKFHAEAHRQLSAGKGLAQGPYVAAKAGVEPMTLRLKVIDSSNAPPRPTKLMKVGLSKPYLQAQLNGSEVTLQMHSTYMYVNIFCGTDCDYENKSVA